MDCVCVGDAAAAATFLLSLLALLLLVRIVEFVGLFHMLHSELADRFKVGMFRTFFVCVKPVLRNTHTTIDTTKGTYSA